MHRARGVLLVAGILFFLFAVHATASDRAIDLRLTLSGHILIGVGVRSEVSAHTWAEMGVYTGVANTLNGGIHIGVSRTFGRSDRGSPVVSIGFDQMVAKDKSKGWVGLPLIKSTVGYWFEVKGSALGPELWIAYFPLQKKLVPIGVGIVRSW